MKRDQLLILVLFLFLLFPMTQNPANQILPVQDNSLSSFDSDQYRAKDGWGEGFGGFTETNDYTDTWLNDGTYWYLSDSLLISMILIVQLDILTLTDSIVLFADWRFTASSSDYCFWAIGDSDGDIIPAHNNIYSYYGTNTGYEERTISIDVDADIINAQNSTGYISFIITAAGVVTYGIYCDYAYIGKGYDYDFRETIPDDSYFTSDPSQFLTIYGYGEGIGGFTETNDYTDTQTNDGTYWYLSDSLSITMRMFMQLPDLSSFDVISFHADWRGTASSSDTIYWAIGDSDGDIITAHNNIYSYTGTDSGYEDHHETLLIDADMINAQNSTGYISFIITAAGVVTYGLYCDWAYIELYRNDTCFTESFADISDWTIDYGTFSSNGDTGTLAGTEWTIGLTGYQYRQKLTITGSSGASTNYPIRLNVTRATGTSSGDNVFVGSKCQSNFGDIRFTDNDMTTELDYWHEYTSGSFAMFWVEVADSLESSAELYIYYGTTGTSTTTSNGTNTFLFFDDFENNNFNRWDTHESNWEIDTTVEKRGTYCAFGNSGGTNRILDWSFSQTNELSIMIHSWVRTNEITGTKYVFQGYNEAASGAYLSTLDDNDVKFFNGTWYDYSTNSISVDTWYEWETAIDFDNSKFLFYLDGNYENWMENDLSSGVEMTDLKKFASVTSSTTSQDHYLDDFYIRKWIANEPTPSTWTSEESYDNISRSYTTFSSKDYYDYYYSFYISEISESFKLQYYSSSTWYNVTTVSDTGFYSGIMSNLTASTITRLGIYSTAETVTIDFLRISEPIEQGWQHDASTTSGCVNGYSEFSTDGDKLNCTSLAGTQGTYFYIDDTDTNTVLDTDYFQFLEISITDVNNNDADSEGWLLRAHAIDSSYEDIGTSSTDTGIFKFNLQALTSLTDDIESFVLYVDGGDSITIDYLKAFSIANFTVTSSSTTINDIVYVENGIIIANMSTGSFILDYDPLYQNITDSLTWNKSTSFGTSYLSFNYDGWSEYYADTTGNLRGAFTLTDFRIKFNESSTNIIAITFESLPPQWNIANEYVTFELDLPEWVVCPIVIFFFFVPINQATIDYFLMFIGLLLIPISTLYLVHGGKENISTDKLLVFLLLIFAAIGLLIGGLIL